jgi:hypothetical protein
MEQPKRERARRGWAATLAAWSFVPVLIACAACIAPKLGVAATLRRE